MSTASPDPAMLVLSRVMRPGRDDAYDAWVERVAAAALGEGRALSTARLDQAGGIHHLLLHFETEAAMRDWRQGATFAALVAEGEAFSVGLAQAGRGTAPRFDLPSEAAAKKWKTALVTWLGVVPALLLFSTLVRWLLPAAPRLVQQVLSSILLTVALTWFILPRVRGWSRFWMLQASDGSLRRDADG